MMDLRFIEAPLIIQHAPDARDAHGRLVEAHNLDRLPAGFDAEIVAEINGDVDDDVVGILIENEVAALPVAEGNGLKMRVRPHQTGVVFVEVVLHGVVVRGIDADAVQAGQNEAAAIAALLGGSGAAEDVFGAEIGVGDFKKLFDDFRPRHAGLIFGRVYIGIPLGPLLLGISQCAPGIKIDLSCHGEVVFLLEAFDAGDGGIVVPAVFAVAFLKRFLHAADAIAHHAVCEVVSTALQGGRVGFVQRVSGRIACEGERIKSLRIESAAGAFAVFELMTERGELFSVKLLSAVGAALLGKAGMGAGRSEGGFPAASGMANGEGAVLNAAADGAYAAEGVVVQSGTFDGVAVGCSGAALNRLQTGKSGHGGGQCQAHERSGAKNSENSFDHRREWPSFTIV